jgi:hypothetical protein
VIHQSDWQEADDQAFAIAHDNELGVGISVTESKFGDGVRRHASHQREVCHYGRVRGTALMAACLLVDQRRGSTEMYVMRRVGGGVLRGERVGRDWAPNMARNAR